MTIWLRRGRRSGGFDSGIAAPGPGLTRRNEKYVPSQDDESKILEHARPGDGRLIGRPETTAIDGQSPGHRGEDRQRESGEQDTRDERASPEMVPRHQNEPAQQFEPGNEQGEDINDGEWENTVCDWKSTRLNSSH